MQISFVIQIIPHSNHKSSIGVLIVLLCSTTWYIVLHYWTYRRYINDSRVSIFVYYVSNGRLKQKIKVLLTITKKYATIEPRQLQKVTERV